MDRDIENAAHAPETLRVSGFLKKGISSKSVRDCLLSSGEWKEASRRGSQDLPAQEKEENGSGKKQHKDITLVPKY